MSAQEVPGTQREMGGQHGAKAKQAYQMLWDGLELLIIPIVLALGAFLLWRADRKLAGQRRQDDQGQAKSQQAEAALLAYIERMTALLLDEKHPFRTSQPEDKVRSVVRARTLTTLRGLDPVRKGLLLKFLYEAKLINPAATAEGQALIDLSGADLSGAAMSRSNLSHADLSGVDLTGANLRETLLQGIIFQGANLHGADLRSAKLQGCNLNGANLRDADMRISNLSDVDLRPVDLRTTNLEGATLRGVNLRGADLGGGKLYSTDLGGADLQGCNLQEADLELSILQGANLYEADLQSANFLGADLRFANLERAIVDDEQLAIAMNLDQATMPDGKTFDPSIHTFWKGPPAEPQLSDDDTL